MAMLIEYRRTERSHQVDYQQARITLIEIRIQHEAAVRNRDQFPAPNFGFDRERLPAGGELYLRGRRHRDEISHFCNWDFVRYRTECAVYDAAVAASLGRNLQIQLLPVAVLFSHHYRGTAITNPLHQILDVGFGSFRLLIEEIRQHEP